MLSTNFVTALFIKATNHTFNWSIKLENSGLHVTLKLAGSATLIYCAIA